jgi:hypothetical protein
MVSALLQFWAFEDWGTAAYLGRVDADRVAVGIPSIFD